jgi:hypothetical protein
MGRPRRSRPRLADERRGNDRRGDAWREQGERRGGWGGYGYASTCYWARRGFYNNWGQYEDVPVQVCR